MKALDIASRVFSFTLAVLVMVTASWMLFSNKDKVIPISTTTTFETLLVNDDGDTIVATFTVDNDDVIYFITGNRWHMMTPRSE